MDLSSRIRVLDIRFSRCQRHGRMRLKTLIGQYGGGFGVQELRAKLSADCEHADGPLYARCDVYFPQLAKLKS